ncbi:WD40/YVTN repeat-like-containing domain [Penicillium camemberti]|uniref:WD40/YVTN repeat-like-containing domain n=1 Tax=Penicillium camemberti (strain FM 013) TaxID=1429867 RepID=A0A0G4P7G3_PENC3|nr:WD40/YVTN repeat-like-containing domain [Penicillium camemberti]
MHEIAPANAPRSILLQKLGSPIRPQPAVLPQIIPPVQPQIIPPGLRPRVSVPPLISPPGLHYRRQVNVALADCNRKCDAQLATTKAYPDTCNNRYTADMNATAFSPNSRLVETASRDGTAKVWNVSTRNTLYTLQHSEFVRRVTFSPNGQLVAIVSRNGTAKVWDATSGALCYTLQHSGYVSVVTFSPNGQLVAPASQDKTAKVWWNCY